MKVLIDTNVALTYVSGREDKFSDQSDKIMLLWSYFADPAVLIPILKIGVLRILFTKASQRDNS